MPDPTDTPREALEARIAELEREKRELWAHLSWTTSIGASAVERNRRRRV